MSKLHKIELSAVLTVLGIILLFSTAITVVLISPSFVDPSWSQPSSSYQVQMYEVSDPNFYVGKAMSGSSELEFVNHIKKGYTLLAFHETPTVRILAPDDLKQYVTGEKEEKLKLTSRLLLLRTPGPDKKGQVEQRQKDLQTQWEKDHPDWKEKEKAPPFFEILELYALEGDEAFAPAATDGITDNWVDGGTFEFLDPPQFPHQKGGGVIYLNNPREYRVEHYTFGSTEGWRYSPNGEPIQNLSELKKHPLGFRSRQELIALGEHIYAIEGCWYCHTDQTRTLVQDVVLNGSASYPAPPSAANEYIYQYITFPGTRRIGPDLSRTAIKRPYRDWHKGHFWAPRTASEGSIMPAFRHFFDNDPRGQGKSAMGIPNYRFEAIYQYLMTKGTRITPPTQAWWLGKDPVNTKAIIEGRNQK